VNEESKHQFADVGTIQKLTRLLAAPVIEPSQRAARIQAVERDIVLPLRLLIIIILGYYFFFSGWLDTPGANTTLEAPRFHHVAAPRLDVPGTNIALEAGTNKPNRLAGLRTAGADSASDWSKDWSLRNASALKGSFIAYALLNLAVGAVFFKARHLTLTKIEWMVFAAGALDCVLMGTLTFLSSGFQSNLFWVFVALILHNALAIPVAFPQLLLNFLSIGAFVAGGMLDTSINPRPPIMDVEYMSKEKPFERIIVLVAWALCCYGIQVLF